MKKLIIISILIFANCLLSPEDKEECYKRQIDSALIKLEWDGNIDYWKRPIYKYWTTYYGSHYYRKNDTTIIAYGDTIIFPLLTGWVTDEGSGRPSYNWDTTQSYYGIRNDGMPYWLDSLELIVDNLGEDPQMDVAFQYAAPYWMPSMVPPYVKYERERDRAWMREWGFWPETPDHNGEYGPRLDKDNFIHAIGDTIEILEYLLPSYHLKFLLNHANESYWTNHRNLGWLWDYEEDPRDLCDRIGFGVIVDRWVEPMNGIRYYKVFGLYDYSTRTSFNHYTVRVAEEIRKFVPKGNKWENGGIER